MINIKFELSEEDKSRIIIESEELKQWFKKVFGMEYYFPSGFSQVNLTTEHFIQLLEIIEKYNDNNTVGKFCASLYKEVKRDRSNP